MEKEISSWTKIQLQAHLRKLGLNISGNKSDLIKRIRDTASSKSSNTEGKVLTGN